MNYPCVFCADVAVINAEGAPKRPTCKECLRFILSTPEPTLQAFRMGALLGAWESPSIQRGQAGQKVRDIAAKAEERRQLTGILE